MATSSPARELDIFLLLYIYICFFLSFCFFFLLESGCIAFFLWQRVGRSIRAAAFIRFPSSEAQHPAPSSDDGREITLHTHIHKRREREQEISRAIVSPSSITVDRDVVDVQPEEEEEEEEKKT